MWFLVASKEICTSVYCFQKSVSIMGSYLIYIPIMQISLTERIIDQKTEPLFEEIYNKK